MDELEDVIQCRFCGYIQLYKIKICSECKEELGYIIPENLNDLSFLECIKLIDNAFFRVESFMKGKIYNYNYFGFNDYFSKLFYECKKEENFTVENCDLISPYWSLAYMLFNNIDKGYYKNEEAAKNENFFNDWNQLCIVSNDRLREFLDFDTNEYAESKYSITDIIAERHIQITTPEQYGEMFSNNGFELFEHILIEHVKPKEKTGRKSDLIYYYWEMYNSKTQYIHQRPESFFRWYATKYEETTGQLRTYDTVKTEQRKKNYSTALDWFKSTK